MPDTATITTAMRDCAHLCHECHDACTELIPHCLILGGAHARAGHIGLLLDCADICLTAEDFMHRGSARHGATCGVCAEVCQECADDCQRIAGEDQEMMRCAEACSRCAESCREMAS